MAFPRLLPAAAVLALALVLGLPAFAAPPERLEVAVVHLDHRTSQDALVVVRRLLSSLGTVEEQPAGNDLVLRDTPDALARIRAALAAFDRPPRDLRFDIHLVRATPAGAPMAPISELAVNQPDLSPELVERLRGFLRYDQYQILAWAGVASKEGEAVSRLLGREYAVSFRTGAALPGERLKLEGFKIVRAPASVVHKGRQLPPRELFHASLNLQLDRPFALVLAEQPGADGASREGLMVAIVCRREESGR